MVWVRRYLYHNFMTEEECDVSVSHALITCDIDYLLDWNPLHLHSCIATCWGSRLKLLFGSTLVVWLRTTPICRALCNMDSLFIAQGAELRVHLALSWMTGLWVCMFWVSATNSACSRDCFKERTSIDRGGQRDWRGRQLVNTKALQFISWEAFSCADARDSKLSSVHPDSLVCYQTPELFPHMPRGELGCSCTFFQVETLCFMQLHFI